MRTLALAVLVFTSFPTLALVACSVLNQIEIAATRWSWAFDQLSPHLLDKYIFCRATLIMSPCGDIRNVPFWRRYDNRNVP